MKLNQFEQMLADKILEEVLDSSEDYNNFSTDVEVDYQDLVVFLSAEVVSEITSHYEDETNYMVVDSCSVYIKDSELSVYHEDGEKVEDHNDINIDTEKIEKYVEEHVES